jgi:hypothetical protein
VIGPLYTDDLQSFIDLLMGRINFIRQVRGKDDPWVVRLHAQFEQHFHNLTA